jgi:inosine-uridine nucleoside N-ribohydrolase
MAPHPTRKQKVIVDTDPGHDDALAILLLEKSGLFDIQAITTVAGNSTIGNTTNNARYILDLIKSKTPLYSGAKKPLKRELIQANVHGASGLAGATIKKEESLSGDAAEKIIEIVRGNPHEISIVCIGPETNLAQAFLKDEQLPSLVKQMVIMGGAIEVPGNKNRVAEFNIFVDPEAADIVFRAPVKKILVPLDVCNDIFLTIEDFEKLRESPLYNPIKEMMKEYIGGIQKFEKTMGALMYDPLAAYYLINPGAYKISPMDIQIEINGDLTRGMAVADRRNWGEKKYNIDVVNFIDRDAFVNDFLEILGR